MSQHPERSGQGVLQVVGALAQTQIKASCLMEINIIIPYLYGCSLQWSWLHTGGVGFTQSRMSSQTRMGCLLSQQ